MRPFRNSNRFQHFPVLKQIKERFASIEEDILASRPSYGAEISVVALFIVLIIEVLIILRQWGQDTLGSLKRVSAIPVVFLLCRVRVRLTRQWTFVMCMMNLIICVSFECNHLPDAHTLTPCTRHTPCAVFSRALLSPSTIYMFFGDRQYEYRLNGHPQISSCWHLASNYSVY